MKSSNPTKNAAKNKKQKENSVALAKASRTATVAELKSGLITNAPAFPVVGVGASAGGLEAFTQLLKALPRDPGMAFVLVPHLDPTHESQMTELLARATPMKVFQVHDGIRLKPNQVYVIPPNRDMTILDGGLRLVSREGLRGLHMPIDIFFRSLAAELHSNAIGVILSGTASDGTLGVTAIKSEGGITIAQEGRSARYDGMPNSAIASGCIDLILTPEKIAEALTRIRQHPYVTDPQLEGDEHSQIDRNALMARIFTLLRHVCKVDFSDYKPATIRRRILRRMALSRIEDLGEYVKLLQDNRHEVESLYQDILINVTSFFRDPKAFDALRETVYPEILKTRPPAETIRVWVPGCSTGEEAYSHAIALLEYGSEVRGDLSIQIFGTDLSVTAIHKARAGIYKESIRADVNPDRLKRFFNRVDSGYQISKSVRDMCVFANQNVFSDPPFSRTDIVSCRNVLIYLSQSLQKRVLPIFHYALRPGGFLMVGNTEGLVGAGGELFDLAHKHFKIYRKRDVPSPAIFGIQPARFDARVVVPEQAGVVPAQDPLPTPIDLHREADRLLLARYVPASVLVSSELDVLQTRGQASRYLELPTGKASLNLLKMVKPGLLYELQNAIEEGRKNRSAVRKDNVSYESDGTFTTVSLEVIPFLTPTRSNQNLLIVFEDRTDGQAKPRTETPPVPPEDQDSKDQLIGQLRHELTATKEYQQSIIEALEASNEELQSANEEIQSGNEELQSTNEELQTSKEELESANEELNTVNEEMQQRNYELGQVNNDLVNLLDSVSIPILMLSSDLVIRRFTPQAENLLGLSAADKGRPVLQVRMKFAIPEFEQLLVEVMRSAATRQREFEHESTSYRMQITPYRTAENKVEGVVAVFWNLADLKNKPKAAGKHPKTMPKRASVG